MESSEVTYHVEIKAFYKDPMGYTNIVFQNLEYENIDYKYIMAVMFPNWDQPTMTIGDIGYVTVKYVQAGVDKWFDGQHFNTYLYSNVIFQRFVEEKCEVDIKDMIID